MKTREEVSSSSETTVLVVEDERDLADLYTSWLSEEYTVHTVYDGGEALTVLDDSVDVVLLDRRMPGLSGDEVLEKIRKQGNDCQVALVTAVTPGFDILPMNFDEYLTKPVTRDELTATVSELEKRQNLEGELRQYFSFLAKKSKLESEKTPDELADNVRYNVITNEIQKLREEFDAELTELANHVSDHQSKVLPPWRVVVDGAIIIALAAALIGVHYAVPQTPIPSQFGAASQTSPAELIFSSFIHQGVSHLTGNVAGYLVFAFLTYYLCYQLDAVRWFYFTTPILVIAISFIAPLASHQIYNVLFPQWTVYILGFSSVVAGLGAFSFLATLFALRRIFDYRTVFLLGGFIVASTSTGILWGVGRGLSMIGMLGVVGTLTGAIVSHKQIDRTNSSSTAISSMTILLIIATGLMYVAVGISLFPSFRLDNTARVDIFGHLVGLVLGFIIASSTAFLVNLFPISDAVTGQ